MLQASFRQAQLSEKQQKYMSKMRVSIDNVQQIMEKFTHSSALFFEEYIDQKKMVVFD